MACRNPSALRGIPRDSAVDCAEIRQGFLTGEVPSGRPVDEHLDGCAQCRELFQNSAELGRGLASVVNRTSTSTSTSDRVAAVSSAIAAERGLRAFLRSRPTRVRWLLSLSLPALLLLRELAHQRVPWRSLSVPRLFGALILLGVLVLATRSALRPLPIARRAARLRWALALVAWCVPCLLWFTPDAQASGEELTGNFALHSLTCFAYGSALAAPSCALLWALDRGVRVPFRVWALAAGVVALVANLILLIHCASNQRAHWVAGHFSIGLAWFLAVSAGEWWRRRVQV